MAKNTKYDDETLLAAIEILKDVDASDYLIERVADFLPASKRPTRDFNGAVQVDIHGPDEMTDADLKRFNAAIKKQWAPIEVISNKKTYTIQVVSGWEW